MRIGVCGVYGSDILAFEPNILEPRIDLVANDEKALLARSFLMQIASEQVGKGRLVRFAVVDEQA